MSGRSASAASPNIDGNLTRRGSDMSNQDFVFRRTASIEERVGAIQAALEERGLNVSAALDELAHKAQHEWGPRNGARVVAKAWTDPAFRTRLLANGTAAIAELGLTM